MVRRGLGERGVRMQCGSRVEWGMGRVGRDQLTGLFPVGFSGGLDFDFRGPPRNLAQGNTTTLLNL